MGRKTTVKYTQLCSLHLHRAMNTAQDTETCDLCRLEARVEELENPLTQRVYDCGCVTCICENEHQCHGCGAKNCGDLRGPNCGYARRVEIEDENKRLREAIVDKHCSCIWGTTDPDNRPYREEICWRCDTLEDLGIDPEREKL